MKTNFGTIEWREDAKTLKITTPAGRQVELTGATRETAEEKARDLLVALMAGVQVRNGDILQDGRGEMRGFGLSRPVVQAMRLATLELDAGSVIYRARRDMTKIIGEVQDGLDHIDAHIAREILDGIRKP